MFKIRKICNLKNSENSQFGVSKIFNLEYSKNLQLGKLKKKIPIYNIPKITDWFYNF